jgi:hypothetical protein
VAVIEAAMRSRHFAGRQGKRRRKPHWSEMHPCLRRSGSILPTAWRNGKRGAWSIWYRTSNVWPDWTGHG